MHSSKYCISTKKIVWVLSYTYTTGIAPTNAWMLHCLDLTNIQYTTGCFHTAQLSSVVCWGVGHPAILSPILESKDTKIVRYVCVYLDMVELYTYYILHTWKSSIYICTSTQYSALYYIYAVCHSTGEAPAIETWSLGTTRLPIQSRYKTGRRQLRRGLQRYTFHGCFNDTSSKAHRQNDTGREKPLHSGHQTSQRFDYCVIKLNS